MLAAVGKTFQICLGLPVCEGVVQQPKTGVFDGDKAFLGLSLLTDLQPKKRQFEEPPNAAQF